MPYQCNLSIRDISIAMGGDVYLCAPRWTNLPVGNILKDDLLSLWNSKKSLNIREQIANGDFSTCASCVYVSPQPHTHIIRVAKEDLVKKPKRINLLTLSHDNTCNYSCQSCRINVTKPSTTEGNIISNIYHRIIDSKVLEYVNILSLLGFGDPFASPYCLQFLQTVPWDDYPSIKIRISTNGSLLTEKRWHEDLDHISDKIHDIRISVDAATEQTYATNRGPAWAWKSLNENLKFLGKLRKDGRLRSLAMTFVIQANNFKEMADFARWGIELGADSIFFQKMRNWIFTKDDFNKRTIHRPGHLQHSEFLKIFHDPVFNSPEVYLGDFDYSEIENTKAGTE